MIADVRLALIERLRGAPELAAPDVSLWYGHAPDEAPPPVVLLACDNDTRELAHSGPTGLAEATLSVDIWTLELVRALELREAVLSQLHGFCGTVDLSADPGATPPVGARRVRIGYCTQLASAEGFDAVNNLAHAGLDLQLGYHTEVELLP